MASITKSINGVVATIDPAILASFGPSGQAIDFTSQHTTGESLPITITFDQPVSSFSLDVVGLTFNGHTTRLYNTNGQQVASIVTNPLNPTDIHGSVDRISFEDDTKPVIKVVMWPPSNDYVGYKGLNMRLYPGFGTPPVTITPTTPVPNPTTPPITTTPVVPPQQTPPPPTVPPVRYINLADVVTLDAVVIDRQYIKGSLRAIDPAKINVRNTSTEVDVQVSLAGLAGVTFDPANFTLLKNSSQEVTVNFDFVTIDGLPEGINTVNAAINLNSNSAVFDPLPPVQPPVPPMPPAPAPTPVPQPIPQLPPVVVSTLTPPSTSEIPLVNFARQTVYAPLIPLPPAGTPLTNGAAWVEFSRRQFEYVRALAEFNAAVADGAEIIPRPDGRTSLSANEGNVGTTNDLITGNTLVNTSVPNPPVLISSVQETPVVITPPGDPTLNELSLNTSVETVIPVTVKPPIFVAPTPELLPPAPTPPPPPPPPPPPLYTEQEIISGGTTTTSIYDGGTIITDLSQQYLI